MITVRTPAVLIALSVLAVQTAWAQEASSLIAEVSTVLRLAPGLRILHVYSTPGLTVYTNIDGDSVGINLYRGSPTGPADYLTENIILSTHTLYTDGVPDRWLVSLYDLRKGGKAIVRATQGIGNQTTDNIGDVVQMWHLGLFNGVLVLHVRYISNITPNPNYPREGNPLIFECPWVLVHITGDWKALGLDIPGRPSSADLNQDGKVDAKDLFLFQRQWNR